MNKEDYVDLLEQLFNLKMGDSIGVGASGIYYKDYSFEKILEDISNNTAPKTHKHKLLFTRTGDKLFSLKVLDNA